MGIYGNGFFKTIFLQLLVRTFAVANLGTLGTSLQAFIDLVAQLKTIVLTYIF